MMWVPALVCLQAMVVHGADHLFGGFPRFNLSDNDEMNIIGGQIMTSLPCMVEILKDTQHLCGGTIVSTTKILSAGHCVNPEVTYAGYGAWLKQDLMITRITAASRHPLYVKSTLDYDVGIFTVNPPFRYSNTAQPIKLVESGEQTADDTKVMVAGWGRTTPESSITRPNNLMATYIVVINHQSCVKTMATVRYKITTRMLCAGTYHGIEAHCKGDSGGQLINVVTKKQIGIVSWSHKPCGDPMYPGVYANIADKEIRKFIEININN